MEELKKIDRLNINLGETWVCVLIPVVRKGAINRKLNSSKNMAKRAGLSFNFIFTEFYTYRKTRKVVGGRKVLTKWQGLELRGTLPIGEGWKFIGKIDRREGVNVLKGGAELMKFKNSLPLCEACGKARRRVETFIIRNVEGKFLQVGRNCLKDYFNTDTVLDLAKYYNVFWEMEKEDWDLEEIENGVKFWEIDYFLLLTSSIVLDKGWISRSKAGIGENKATVDMVLDVLLDKNSSVNFTDKDQELKESALSWILGLEEKDLTTTYLHNINTLAKTGYVSMKNAGYIASIIGSYLGSVKREENAKAEKEATLNEWAGKVGDKIEVEVKVIGEYLSNGYYGTTYIYKFMDSLGRNLTWFSSRSKEELAPGNEVILQGTIKKLDTYRGLKTTILTRCKII